MEKKEIPCCLWVSFPLSGTCKCGAMGNEGDGELEDMDADSRFSNLHCGLGALSTLASCSNLTYVGMWLDEL